MKCWTYRLVMVFVKHAYGFSCMCHYLRASTTMKTFIVWTKSWRNIAKQRLIVFQQNWHIRSEIRITSSSKFEKRTVHLKTDVYICRKTSLWRKLCSCHHKRKKNIPGHLSSTVCTEGKMMYTRRKNPVYTS